MQGKLLPKSCSCRKHMDFKKEILDHISAPGYEPKDVERIFSILGYEGGIKGQAQSALDELLASGTVKKTKNGKLTLPAEKGLPGTFMSSTRGFGFVRPEGMPEGDASGDIFIPAKQTRGAVDGDTVLYAVSPVRYGEKTEGKILSITDHAVTEVVGTLLAARDPRRSRVLYCVEPDERKHTFRVYVDNAVEVRAHPGDKVAALITAYPDDVHDALGHITTVFGAAESVSANYEAVLHDHGVRTSFPPEVIENAKEVSSAPVTLDGRLDLRDAVIFTVDGADSKDLDDAISVVKTDEGYELGVHIADVSHYVREDSPLDTEAFARGTSVYFSDMVVPMLPVELSNGICSLNGGVDRYALSAFMTIDNYGNILDTMVEKTLIRSCLRGVYSELNDVISRGARSEFYEKYSVLGDSLKDAVDLYKILAEKSRKRGAVELETTESKIVVDENKNPVKIVKRDRGISERMIEQFMLAANEAVATWLYNKKMPCVYRVHEEPSEGKLTTLKVFAANAGLDGRALHEKNLKASALQGILEQAKARGIDTVISTVVLRSMMKARYSESCSPHFGLAIDKYCHFTSPIRRYPDLATHRIISDILEGRMDAHRLAYLTKFAARAALASSENERRAMGAERDIEDLYRTVYMSSRIGQRYEGHVCSLTNFGMFVELDNTCEGLIPINTMRGYFTFNERNMTLQSKTRVYRLGDKVRVKIASADIVSRRVYMELEY